MMFKTLATRWKQGHRTIPFPPKDAGLSGRYLGRPEVTAGVCRVGCEECKRICPGDAILIQDRIPSMDLGKCLFCGECADICPETRIRFSKEYQMAVNKREALFIHGKEFALARQMDEKIRRVLGRSLKLRQVSAGGCNACEADVNVLGTVGYDLSRFGIQFVASPRHSDGLLVTGPVTRNMSDALLKTYQAVPSPKIVIAVGACAVSGGPFAGHAEVNNGCTPLLPIDLFIPGCPPHPLTILDGLLRLIKKQGAGEYSRPAIEPSH